MMLRLTFQEDILPSEQADILLEQLDAALIHTVSCMNASCTDFRFFEPRVLSIMPARMCEISSDIELLHDFVNKHAQVSPRKVALEYASALDSTELPRDQWTYSGKFKKGSKCPFVSKAASPG